MNNRIIHTGLYTERACLFFKSLMNGIDNIAHTRRLSRSLDNVNVNTAYDGEIIIEVLINNYSYRTTIWSKTLGDDKKAKEWLAGKLKYVVRKSFGSDDVWNRNHDGSMYVVSALMRVTDVELNFTVAEAYFIYDKLLNRKNMDNKYSAEMFQRLIGQQKDPLKAEAERIRREKLKEAEDKFNAEKNRIYNEQQEKLRKAREQFQAEADAEREKAKAAYDMMIAEIERKAAAINNVKANLFTSFVA